MIPRRYEQVLFGLMLSGLMSMLVAGISTFLATGLVADFALLWLRAWMTAWLLAFPAVLVVAPLTRRTVQRLVDKR